MKQMKFQRISLPAAAGVCILCFAVMLAALLFGGKSKQAAFTPPPFDPAAVQGTPQVPQTLGYISPWQEGMGYRFSVCGKVTMDGPTATVYFTNPAENPVWLKLRVLDETGKALGDTGLLKPGEYVKDVVLNETLPAGTPIQLKVMGYEPDTYYSAGAVTLNTTVAGKPQ